MMFRILLRVGRSKWDVRLTISWHKRSARVCKKKGSGAWRGPRGVEKGVAPTYRPAIPIGHDAVKGAVARVEHQRQEVTIALPERQIEHALDFDPFERAFGIVRQRCAVPAIDAEDEAEPVFAVFPEAGPTDGAAQAELVAVEAGFFTNLAAHA